MKKLKKLKETSRGGRRQVLIKNKKIRECCERVAQETGCPFQECFDELMDMFTEGYLFGIGTQDTLFARMITILEGVE